jgi:glycosyltransferase involved in cell wall biosynthesis
VRLLIYSPAFLPHIGGLELNVAQLAEGLASSGHEVVLVTTTASDSPDSHPYAVVRQPSPRDLMRWVRWCDVFYQSNVSLRGLWPLLFVRRPWVVSHHSWYCRTGGRIAWQDRLKRRLLRYATASISVSAAIAADLDTPSVVIQNAYASSGGSPMSLATVICFSSAGWCPTRESTCCSIPWRSSPIAASVPG